MQVGSRGSSLLRAQSPLLVFLTPSITSTVSFGAARTCPTYLALAHFARPKRLINASNASRHASSAAAAAQQPSPNEHVTNPSPQPLLKPSRPRSKEEIESRQSSLLDRIRFGSKSQETPQTQEDRDRQIDSLLRTDAESNKYGPDPASQQAPSTIDWASRTIAENRVAQHKRDYEKAQEQQRRQPSKQGRIARNMNFPPATNVLAQQQSTGLELSEATRATATIKSRPSLGRTVEVLSDRGMDLGRALKILEINCAVNSVRKDANRQRYYERPGMKRKRLKSERWRRRFKIGFKAVVAKVKAMRRKGW